MSVVGKEVEDEGECLASSGLLGSKGERETKMKMRCGKVDKHVFEEVWRG